MSSNLSLQNIKGIDKVIVRMCFVYLTGVKSVINLFQFIVT